MIIMPVLDVQGGIVVHGKHGNRSEYLPIQSVLCDNSQPMDVARALRAKFGLHCLYLADLDAIAGASPLLGLYQELVRDGFRLWVDPGVRNAAQAQTMLETEDLEVLVLGLESIESPKEWERILTDCGSPRVCPSIDLKDGRPLTAIEEWRTSSAEVVVREVVSMGWQRLLLLDLARVGSGEGIGTESLARHAREKSPDIELYLGGGVRGVEDLRMLESLGIAGVLVASALHDGRISSRDLPWKPSKSGIY